MLATILIAAKGGGEGMACVWLVLLVFAIGFAWLMKKT